ncbi:glycerophosphodiester phosphodiesterase [Zobellia galactanivorans]|uniref:Glycerophosphoryl diester phosphodiesterase n=1 Tax=Zobellia galactanivorans (strain DSM 12802 / CCUG 47099 / CIP 106680 / NCIMB 13871 / Dsij) TaxID=63186 RepID=G0L2K9_ZOBGA|nr:glycerophosphodiester phosphodiesterase family protein [Zobellia galactanivorans]CAZ95050.1 Glycerophosphoryl diester phosphodiesterase [Zobellia galactanivorans]
MVHFLKIILIGFLFTNSLNIFAITTHAQKDDPKMPERGICAHRGASKLHPENTISAFKEAVRLGAQMIEFDVRMTIDNKLIIMHDATVDRTTDGSGLVEDLTWNEIKELDAGAWKSKKFKGERVPLLDDVLDVFPKNIWLNVHLKGDKKLGIAVAKTILAKNRTHQAIIACNNESAKGVRLVNSDIMICNMERTSSRSDYIQTTAKEKFAAIQLLKKRDNTNILKDIETLKFNNIKINYFYSNTPEEGITLLNKGVDFVLTDNLSEMLEAARSIGIETSH